MVLASPTGLEVGLQSCGGDPVVDELDEDDEQVRILPLGAAGRGVGQWDGQDVVIAPYRETTLHRVRREGHRRGIVTFGRWTSTAGERVGTQT